MKKSLVQFIGVLMLVAFGPLPAIASDGNILHVGKNGSETNAGAISAPVGSVGNAMAKSQSNDLIYVFPGIYTNGFLLKNLVNLFLLPGTTVYANTNTGFVSASTPATNTISGDGEFRAVIHNPAAESRYDMFKVDNRNSVFDFTANRVSLTGTNAVNQGIFLAAFRLTAVKTATIDIDFISVTAGHNDIVTPIGVTYGSGDFHARIGTITNDAGPVDSELTFAALECLSTGDKTHYDAHFRGDYLRSAVGFSHLSDNPNQINWITYDVMEGNSYAYYVGANSLGKNYISGSKKIWGRSTLLPAMMIHGDVHDWIQSDKISSDGGGWLWQEKGTLECLMAEWEDPLKKVQVGIIHYGGTNNIHPGRMRAAGTCVQHIGGVQIYNGVSMDSSYGTSNVVYVTGSGLTLKNCTLIASPGTRSIEAPSQQTVTIDGALTVNIDPGTNIVFTGGNLIVTAGENSPIDLINAPWGSKYYKAGATNFWFKDGAGTAGWTAK